MDGPDHPMTQGDHDVERPFPVPDLPLRLHLLLRRRVPLCGRPLHLRLRLRVTAGARPCPGRLACPGRAAYRTVP